MTAKLVGDKELMRSFQKNKAETQKATRNALVAGAFEIANEANKNITEKNIIESGNLKRSIDPSQSGNPEVKTSGPVTHAIVGTDVEYGYWQEYGTTPYEVNSPVYIKKINAWRYIGTHPGVQARPFLRPAFDAKKDKAELLIKRVLTKLIRKI